MRLSFKLFFEREQIVVNFIGHLTITGSCYISSNGLQRVSNLSGILYRQIFQKIDAFSVLGTHLNIGTIYSTRLQSKTTAIHIKPQIFM